MAHSFDRSAAGAPSERRRRPGSESLPLKDRELFREQCLIDGRWVSADEGGTLPVRNPATSEQLGAIPNMGTGETRRAIEAAARALPAWAARTAKDRAIAVAPLVRSHARRTSRTSPSLMTAEQGKPLAESKGEIAYAASFIEWFAEEGKRLYGDLIPGHQPDKRIMVLRQPVGVVAAITPWNFPAAMITRKAGPALAAGCTMVLKPATQTPFSALALADLALRAGIPPGVFNVITGSAAAIGGEMTSNPTVRKLTFTGSTEIGKKLMAQCAGTVKKLSLELGGNAPFIVFDDADLEAAVQGAIASKYRNTGPDLRVRQPAARAGRRVRRVCPQAFGGGRQAARRGWAEGRHRSRAAHRFEGRRESRGACGGRGRQGGEARWRAASGTRSAARSSSPPSSPASRRR